VLIGQATDSAALERSVVTDAEVAQQGQAIYQQEKDSLAQTCVELIVAAAGSQTQSQSGGAPPQPSDADYAAAQAKAAAAKAKIDAGQAFADVAKTDSDQPDSATEQCVTQSQLANVPPELVSAITTTPVGKTSDPVKVTDLPGYVLVNVTQHKTPTYDDAKAQIEPTVRAQIGAQRVDDAVNQLANGVSITVDPLFGSWDRNNHQVVAPVGASEPSVPSTTIPNVLDTTPSTTAAAPQNCTPATVTPPPASQKPTVNVTAGAPAPTALDVKSLTPGSGPAIQQGDKVSIEYVGVLAKDGTQFDASWDRNAQPLQFTVGEGDVVPGMDQGVVGLQLGERAQLTIPASLAYGSSGNGSIGPNEALVFVVDVVQICSSSSSSGAAGATETAPAAAAGSSSGAAAGSSVTSAPAAATSTPTSSAASSSTPTTTAASTPASSPAAAPTTTRAG
jgi:peptidylprolyl isomerase